MTKSIFDGMAAAYCSLHFRSLDDESRRHVHGFAAFMAEQTGAGDAPAEAPRVETVVPDGSQATPPLPAGSLPGPLPGPLEGQQQPEMPAEQPPVEVVIMPPAAGQAEQPREPAGA